MAQRYSPGILPSFLQGRQQLENEFQKISTTLRQIQNGLPFDKRGAAPDSPVDGEIVFADGENWDPGGGKGYYWFNLDDETWNKLG